MANLEKTGLEKPGSIEYPSGTGSGAPRTAERTLEEAIGAQIRLHRKRLEITGGELAAAAGLSTGMLSKIENGQISPSLSTLQSLGPGAQSAAVVPVHALRGAP